MNEDLKWEWDAFRNKVATIEQEFIKANKDKYPDYFLLEKALNRELNKRLGIENNILLKLQLLLKFRKRFTS